MSDSFGIQINSDELTSEFAIDENEKIAELRDWQIRAIEHYFKSNGKALYEVSTGAGKTRLGIEIIKKLWETNPEYHVLIVVPKNVILETGWYKELYEAGIGIKDIGVYYGRIKEYGKVTITNMQNMENIATEIFDVVIWDECFSGDTKISVKAGKVNAKLSLKNIVEQKKQYDVYSYNFKTKKIELKPITNWYKIKEEREVYDIELENGNILTVTPEQLIYTPNGYIQAKNLKIQNELYIKKGYKNVFKNNCLYCQTPYIKHPNKKTSFCNTCLKTKRPELLKYCGYEHPSLNVFQEFSKNKKGKKIEEIYGKKTADIMRKKWKTSSQKRKRISYEKCYGKDRAELIKQKCKNTKIKNGSIWTKESIINAYLKLPNMRRLEWKIYRKKKLLPDYNIVKKHFGSLYKLAEITNKPFLKNLERTHKGNNETLILDIIEKNNNIKISRQYAVRDKTGKKYFVDGYDKENNVVYEVDEEYHKHNKIPDKIREDKIKEVLYCKIIRVDEQKFLKIIKSDNQCILKQ